MKRQWDLAYFPSDELGDECIIYTEGPLPGPVEKCFTITREEWETQGEE